MVPTLLEQREFRELYAKVDNQRISDSLAEKGLKWKFNPPASPHFGGPWEKLVRACKQAMAAVLGSRRLTGETLSTTMCLVEQLLNSRPLTPVSADVDDLEAITPCHFLIGRACVFCHLGCRALIMSPIDECLNRPKRS